jgi:NAD/NADP transhydrogenase beta subunit
MVVAILSGLVVLAGYFIPLESLGKAKQTLIGWAVILAAFAVLLGIMSLLTVHLGKVSRKQKGAIYSLLLVIAMLFTFFSGILSPYFPKIAAISDFTFRSIQLPVEASLMALLVVTLTFASIRLLRTRMDLFSIVFILTGLFILAGTAPLPFIGEAPLFSTLRPAVSQVLATSGARGILIGVSLGALVAGLRVIFGADRPYGGK